MTGHMAKGSTYMMNQQEKFIITIDCESGPSGQRDLQSVSNQLGTGIYPHGSLSLPHFLDSPCSLSATRLKSLLSSFPPPHPPLANPHPPRAISLCPNANSPHPHPLPPPPDPLPRLP